MVHFLFFFLWTKMLGKCGENDVFCFGDIGVISMWWNDTIFINASIPQ